MTQTVAAKQTNGSQKKAISLVDSDVHNYPDSIDELVPYLPQRWKAYIKQSGFSNLSVSHYPKVYAQAARRDSFPPNGKRSGSDPDFSRQQLLDAWEIDIALLNPLVAVSAVHNIDFANALMRATNEWMAAVWLDSDPRWRGSIVVNTHDPEAAGEEIRRAAKDSRFAQVLLLVRSHAPYGRRQFHPIFAAAEEVGLPVGIHFGGSGSGNPITPCGWPSYYIEDHTAMSQAFEAQLTSIVCEGIFEKFPKLKLGLIEGGFAWLPALMWRLDKNYRGLRSEVPWLTRLPSEYILDHCRFTTQPMEEPANPQHLLYLFEMIGRDDFFMFATDYPHWDFDAPDRALPSVVSDELRQRIMCTNALEFYGFEHA